MIVLKLFLDQISTHKRIKIYWTLKKNAGSFKAHKF